MTCAVPLCPMDAVMQSVCSAHWLEGDDARQLVELEHAVIESRGIVARQAQVQRKRLERAAKLRELDRQEDRQDRVFARIVEKFWQQAGEESGRNRALAGAAWAAGRLVAGGELDGQRVTDTLIAEGERAGLPHHEAKYVVTQQVRRARSQPRALERKSIWTSEWGSRW